MSQDQTEAIDFLSDPANHAGAEVRHVQTHGAHVFLTGDEAWKIKRAVKYDYMDFSTLELRETMLRRELDLNRPAAPDIYLDVVPVTRDAGGLALDGDGEVAEWVLRMRRFPTENELSAIAERGGLTEALAAALKRAKYGADERPAGRERQAMAEAVPATEEKLDSGAPDSEVEAEDAAGKVAMQAWEAEAAEEESASALASGWRRLLRR